MVRHPTRFGGRGRSERVWPAAQGPQVTLVEASVLFGSPWPAPVTVSEKVADWPRLSSSTCRAAQLIDWLPPLAGRTHMPSELVQPEQSILRNEVMPSETKNRELGEALVVPFTVIVQFMNGHGTPGCSAQTGSGTGLPQEAAVKVALMTPGPGVGVGVGEGAGAAVAGGAPDVKVPVIVAPFPPGHEAAMDAPVMVNVMPWR